MLLVAVCTVLPLRLHTMEWLSGHDKVSAHEWTTHACVCRDHILCIPQILMIPSCHTDIHRQMLCLLKNVLGFSHLMSNQKLTVVLNLANTKLRLYRVVLFLRVQHSLKSLWMIFNKVGQHMASNVCANSMSIRLHFCLINLNNSTFGFAHDVWYTQTDLTFCFYLKKIWEHPSVLNILLES